MSSSLSKLAFLLVILTRPHLPSSGALAQARVEVKLVAPPELVVELSGRPDLKLHAFSCVVSMEGSSVAELQAR